MKVAVLGAGVSGLTIARLLCSEGVEVTIMEKMGIKGGLATSAYIDGYLYEPCEGHVFNSKREEVVEWMFSSILPKEHWKKTERNSQIYFQGKYVPYPFELALNKLDVDLAAECICDYIQARSGEKPDNYESWIRWYFGNGIAENYMLPYNRKIWNYPLGDMGVEWMNGKMPLPSKKELVKSILLDDHKENYMVHSSFYYPLHGVQEMIEALADGLNIQLSREVKLLTKEENYWVINGEDKFDFVISTIPLPYLLKAMNLPEKVGRAITDLKYNGMTTILCKSKPVKETVLYIPSPKYRAHRISYISSLTPYACPEGMGSASVAIIGDRIEVDQLIGRNNTIVPEQLELGDVVASSHTEFAYTIFDKNYQKNISVINNYFDDLENFELLGKFSRWTYNNMDLCIWDAFNLADKFKKQI